MALMVRHQGFSGWGPITAEVFSYSVTRLPDGAQLDFADGQFKAASGVGTAQLALAYNAVTGLHEAVHADTAGWIDGHYLVGIHQEGAAVAAHTRPAYVENGVDEALAEVGNVSTSPEMVFLAIKHRLIDRGVFLPAQCEIGLAPEPAPSVGALYGRIQPPDWRTFQSEGMGRYGRTLTGRINVRVYQRAVQDHAGGGDVKAMVSPTGLMRRATKVCGALDEFMPRQASFDALLIHPLELFGLYPPKRYGADRQWFYQPVPLDAEMVLKLPVAGPEDFD